MMRRPLGDFAKIQQGRYLSKDAMAASYSPSNPIPVHGANGIIGWTDKAMYEDGVPLVTCRGSNCGMVLWADGPLWVSNNAMAILPHSGLRRFAYYRLLSSPPFDVVSGSAQPQITRSALAPREYDLPPEDAHAGIEAILAALDDKIELNRRMNETLEAQARALFRDWFVDFGPVKAKMAGAAPYLAPELWSLFPDRLEDESVPEGWALSTIDELADLRGGKQLDKSEISSTGPVPVFGGAGLMGYTAEPNATGYVVTVGRVGAYCGQFFAHRGKAWVNNNASLIRAKDRVSSEWLFLALKELDVEVIKKGAAQPFISNGDLAAMSTVWPTSEVMDAFLRIALPLIRLGELNSAESQTLAQTRDLLLPKLMSGEIRVSDVERELESA